MIEYNGHRSWNAWNVSLWISNDERLYQCAMECIKEAQRIAAKLSAQHQAVVALAGRAARYFLLIYGNSKTPDGAIYNLLSVRLCLQDYLDD